MTNIISWGYVLFVDADAVNRYFVNNANFSDFFTPMTKTRITTYSEPHFSNYPPLANIFFLIMRKANYTVEYSELINDTALGVFFLLFMLLSFLGLYEMSKRYMINGNKVINVLCILSLLTSGPFLYLYSRSNILIFVVVLLMFFSKYYSCENKYLRELSYIALAFATALKIYPVFFGLLLIKKGNFKNYMRTLIYGIVLFFIPFLVYGTDSLSLFINNLFFREGITVLNHAIGIKGAIQLLWGLIRGEIIRESLNLWWGLALLLMVCILILNKTEWKRTFAVSMLCIWTFNGSYLYNVCLLAIPLLMFVNEENTQIKDWIYTILFAILFVILFLPDTEQLNLLLQAENLGYVSGAIIVTNIMLIVLALFAFVDSIYEEVIRRKAKSKSKVK